jgi:S-DNA-T family DNA segregation ATPase FtsK/SpoIIIE
VALGRDTHGQPVVTDLTKLPHILVAGATGSGKSVFLNSMVIGFLLQFTPDDLRMLMIDPKRVELTGFNGIPHLLRPVVTDVRMEKDPQVRARDKAGTQNERERPLTAVEALKWALWEMERRYKVFAKGHRGADGVTKVFRNIEQYRTFSKENPTSDMEYLPYIVIIIDELADLMMTCGSDVEEAITRLAQMARAVGIHLVLATQRPSVDVITGLIKANFPSRIAFRVSQKVDSRTIIDANGAEQLLGRGDMLFLPPGTSRLLRVHGAYLDEQEVSRVVAHIKAQGGEPVYDETITLSEGEAANADAASGERDELFEQALRICCEMKRASTSVLQRRLRIGYGRAAAILDALEREGFIGQADGARPRPVLGRAYEAVSHWDDLREEDLEDY